MDTERFCLQVKVEHLFGTFCVVLTFSTLPKDRIKKTVSYKRNTFDLVDKIKAEETIQD